MIAILHVAYDSKTFQQLNDITMAKFLNSLVLNYIQDF